MEKWFKKQSRLVQIILLLIPGVNWIVEILVRWDHALNKKKKSLFKIAIALIYTVGGMVLGYLDLVWCLLFKRLFLCK